MKTGFFMRIHKIIWHDERIDHIARHGVTSQEFEEVCFGKSLIRRGKSEGDNPVYYVQGKTRAGRFLFCVIIAFPDKNGFPITAREMTEKEKSRFRKWRTK